MRGLLLQPQGAASEEPPIPPSSACTATWGQNPFFLLKTSSEGSSREKSSLNSCSPGSFEIQRYCSPQQFIGGGFPFPDGDLWALGVRMVFIQATELGILAKYMLAS